MPEAYDPPTVLLDDGPRLGDVALGDAALGDVALGDVTLGGLLLIATDVAVVIVVLESSDPLWLGKSDTDTAAKGGSFGKVYVKGRSSS